ncbi:MAG: hypothetical protein RL414_429 [Actinomycetota bacterium]
MFDKYVARMSRPTPGWPALQKIRFVMHALLISNVGLVIVYFMPKPFPGKDNPWNGSFAYWMLALIYVGFMTLFKLPSLSFMRLPLLDWKSGIAMLVALAVAAQRVDLGMLAHKSAWTLFVGIITLLSIGLGEEIVSRGFVYGIFTRFGQNFAIVLSSVLFGLLHLGWYMGKYWDPWMAYWHVANAAASGFFLCCLMIACRSIWPAVLLHGVWDWRIGFDYANVPFPKAGHTTHSAFMTGITAPLRQLVPCVFFGMTLVYLRGGTLPKWLEKVALRFKLVEV